MANSITATPNNVLITDTGKTFYGTAVKNSQIDNYSLEGANDTIIGEGGNLNVTGGQNPFTGAWDTNSSIYLNSLFNAPITGVTDKITLDGSHNTLSNATPQPGTNIEPIQGSTITFKVVGAGGYNSVDLENLSNSTVNLTVGTSEPFPYGADGHNTVEVNNSGGTTTASVTGPNNDVTLNGDATNTVKFSNAGNTLTIGGQFGGNTYDDDLFGFVSKVTLVGGYNTVNGGDENFTINGAWATGGNNTVSLGDGNNNITLGGAGNSVSVWGGNNNIDAGGDGAYVQILGVDGENLKAFSDTGEYPNFGPDDAAVPASPTDTVTIRGAGDEVDATYENVIILGSGVTDGATIDVGDGNNIIVLGGDGHNQVSVGNGANSINATGSNSYYELGKSSNNGITLGDYNGVAGDGNTISADGGGLDTVQLGDDTNSHVSLNAAGGSVTGTATTGRTFVSQNGPLGVTVNLNGGTGTISLGDGNDTVTANGASTYITLGNGKDTVIANGKNDGIVVGNGVGTTITANGSGDHFSIGNGSDTVTANGNNDIFKFGSGTYNVYAGGNGDVGTFGTSSGANVLPAGNVSLDAEGSGDSWTLTEASTSTVTATLGSRDSLSQTNGTLNATLIGDGDTLSLIGTNSIGTTVANIGDGETINFSGNAGGTVTLNPASQTDTLTFTGTSDKYTGNINVSGLNSSDALTFADIWGYTNGNGALNHITNNTQLIADLTTGAGGTEVLKLQGGGGQITFAANTPFTNLTNSYS
jgi:hypothetical protein